VEIDRILGECGWAVQSVQELKLHAGRGVAVREVNLNRGHGTVDYLLFVDGKVIGIVEAKAEGTPLIGVEPQSAKYVEGFPDRYQAWRRPLCFAYESTGVETRFTNGLDPEPRSRRVFAFHRPETLAAWAREAAEHPEASTLRHRLEHPPELRRDGLWPAQEDAIRNLERSLAHGRPRALIQMATGAGKTFTAANAVYRLIKHARATRVLFLVDRANLGKQTLKEFQQFITPDDGRKFTELYNVQRLSSNSVDRVSRVVITTVQRLYSMLRGEPSMPDEWDEYSPMAFMPSRPVEVSYNPTLPVEFFDFIVVDECHRSIYGIWRQVLDYFDAFVIGLTATPSKQTFGFFNQNLVKEYDHARAVADGVNADFDVYRISTRITERGDEVDAGIVTAFRDRQTRRVRWELLDDDLPYSPEQLDRDVVARDQIRTVIQVFKERLFTEIFPGRQYVPKTLIFAKDDSHADDIVDIVREEFGKGNEFAVKITYRSARPDNLIAEFRNSFNPRIAVTVDMIATGTDVKPIECVFFMRSVKSRMYFEQMKGRGVRVIDPNDLQAVTPDAAAKTRFVVVDAVGVTEAKLNDTLPLERQPYVRLDTLLQRLAFGERSEQLASTLASRLAKLDRQITRQDREALELAAGGRKLSDLASAIVAALDPDTQLKAAQEEAGVTEPSPEQIAKARTSLLDAALAPLASDPALRQQLMDIRRSYEQAIDETSQDEVLDAGYSRDATQRAHGDVTSFRQFIEEHRDEITALQVLYSQPYRDRLTYEEIKELANAIGRPPHNWTPEGLWTAYETLDASKVRGSGGRMLTDIVSLVRFALSLDGQLVPYRDLVNERFAAWQRTQEQAGRTFTPEQLAWLERIRDHLAASLTIGPDDFEFTPFVEHGGLGRAHEVFGEQLNSLLSQLTEALAA